MAEISAAETSEFSTIGFIVLRKQIDISLVRRARDAIAREIEDTRKTAKGNAVFATVSDDKNWPSDCQTLFEAIEKSISPALFCPTGAKLRIFSRIGVYQPNPDKGRGAPNTVFFTTPLDTEALVSGVNMPDYYYGSHINGSSQTIKKLTLEEGDVLVWDGMTVFGNAARGGGGFMLIKHFWG